MQFGINAHEYIFFKGEQIARARRASGIRLCRTAAILSRETKKALFYHAKPRSGNHGDEAWRGKRKLFWSPGTIWPPCDKGEFVVFILVFTSDANTSANIRALISP